jgi:hypothetical protein
MSKTIEYAPVRRRGLGIASRLAFLCFGLAVVFLVVGNAVADPINGSFAGLWLVGGALLAGVGVIVAAASWVVTGWKQ